MVCLLIHVTIEFNVRTTRCKQASIVSTMSISSTRCFKTTGGLCQDDGGYANLRSRRDMLCLCASFPVVFSTLE
jgi:hypothetical protein